jgi:hypothetical protein
MTISRKIDKPDHPLLWMDNNDIATVSDHKHLGLVISDNGSWEKHIDMITGKAYKRINILRKFKFILDRKTLEKLNFTFVRLYGRREEQMHCVCYNRVYLQMLAVLSSLCSVVSIFFLSFCKIEQVLSLNKKIESVQLEASRIVTGGTRLVSLNNLYMETGWGKLKDRREKHKIVQFYKMTEYKIHVECF